MNATDIFVYSSMDNNLATDSANLNYFASQNIGTSTTNLNDILSMTTLKKACCMIGDGNYVHVNVKLPFTMSDTYDAAPNIANLEKKFGYKNYTVEVTKDMCNGSNINNINQYNTSNTLGKKKCDDFYAVYCTNVLADYIKQNGNKYNMDEFLDYAPECSCYIPKPDIYKKYDLPHKCYVDTCQPNIAHIDPRSRNTPSCETLICENNLNFGNVVLGEHSSINYNPTTACGQADNTQQNNNNNENTNNNTQNNNTQNNNNSNDNTSNDNTSNDNMAEITDSYTNKNKFIYICISSIITCLLIFIIIMIIMAF
jgi:hypothetical protein